MLFLEGKRRKKGRSLWGVNYTSTPFQTLMSSLINLDICDLLGTLNIDIGLNCEELALSGLCSDGMWGDKMDKYCHRSCTSLRGKR